MGNGGDTVGVAVDVHEHAVVRNGVAAGQEHVRVKGRTGCVVSVGEFAAVDEVIAARLERVHEPDLQRAHAAAHRDGAALRDQGEGDLKRLFSVGGVIAGHVARLQTPDDRLRQKRVSFYHIFIHNSSLRIGMDLCFQCMRQRAVCQRKSGEI